VLKYLQARNNNAPKREPKTLAVFTEQTSGCSNIVLYDKGWMRRDDITQRGVLELSAKEREIKPA
jgi:hypothetical protein